VAIFPTFDVGEVFQSITIRLFDSMPQSLLTKWREELAHESRDFEDELRWRIEAYLDKGYGACHLADIRIAGIVQNALLHFDGERYRLSAWVVMPIPCTLACGPVLRAFSLENYAFAQVLYRSRSEQNASGKRTFLV
jgi:hypothetical protein